MVAQARHELSDVGSAPEEPIGIGLLKCRQSGVGTRVRLEGPAAASERERLDLL